MVSFANFSDRSKKVVNLPRVLRFHGCRNVVPRDVCPYREASSDNILRLTPADKSRDVRPESCHTSARWSVNGYVALIADKASRSCVKDHYAKELQVAVRVSLSVRKETGRRLRVYQFWPKALDDLARKNLRSLDGQKSGFCSEARRMFRPVCPRSALSQLNCIWVRKTSVDGEIAVIDSLGANYRRYRKRESKKKAESWIHRDNSNDYASKSYHLDANFSLLY